MSGATAKTKTEEQVLASGETRGLWKVGGVPHKGWKNVGIHDNGEDSFTSCQMCGTDIRYVHTMRHDDYDEDVEAGCMCAEKMCEGYNGKGHESELKKSLSSRRRWVETGWKWSKKSNLWKNTSWYNLTVFRVGGGYKWAIRTLSNNSIRTSPCTYSSMDEAKYALHDELYSGLTG